MVYVQGGTFEMGCTYNQEHQDQDRLLGEGCYYDEKPAHQVTLSDYYIGKYEVTQAQWIEIMGNNPSDSKGYNNNPVENVSWDNVQEFIRRLNEKTGKNYRLPTEAEWEYAARGGNSYQGYRGYLYSGSNNLDDVGWYKGNSINRFKSYPVGGKKANGLGIYDMSGNVNEWCSDWHASHYYSSSPQNNPTGPSDGGQRVYRGGDYYNSPFHNRVSKRASRKPNYNSTTLGFRLCLKK